MSTLIVYVDVDDTLVRTVGTTRIPISQAIRQVQALHKEGVSLYCWSSGGADYAKASAEELGIADCFIDFLPKPNAILDDQDFADWKYLTYLHPNNAGEKTADDLDPMNR